MPDPTDHFDVEMRAVQDGTLSVNLEELERLAVEEHPEAMYRLGVQYAAGLNVRPDSKRAGELILRAAELGYPDAQYHVGFAAAKGLGRKRDVEESRHWYSRASGQGHPDATYELAQLEFEVDEISSGITLLRKAILQDSPKAAFHLGRIYAEGSLVEKNVRTAEALALAAANAGHEEAQFFLGVSYHRRANLNKADISAAYFWHKLVALHGWQYRGNSEAALEELSGRLGEQRIREIDEQVRRWKPTPLNQSSSIGEES